MNLPGKKRAKVKGTKAAVVLSPMERKPRSLIKVPENDDAVIMARPESLRLVDKGEGKFDAKVKLNVYLGNSIETFLETDFGEVLVEIDDPKVKKVYGEGEEVSVDFDPGRVRLLGVSED